jgi:large subunit ribosomal protein L18
MDKAKRKRERRTQAHQRIRSKVAGTSERPRLAVFKSTRYIYAQLVDDAAGHTLVQASSFEPDVRKLVEGSAKGRAAARTVGEVVADRAKEQGIRRVVFDRGGYRYHGRIKELAEAARSKGLQF